MNIRDGAREYAEKRQAEESGESNGFVFNDQDRAMVKGKDGKWEDRSVEILHGLTVAHYTKLGLYTNETALQQKGYALVEAGELTLEVLRNQPEEVKKEIGDVLVTLINWSQLESFNFMRAINDAGLLFHTYSSERLCVNIHAEISVAEDRYDLIKAIEYLDTLARNYSFTLAECLGNAYDKVIARKVKMMGGVLVKEADWHKYPELEKVAVL